MIELYTAATPNGWKVSIALEEMGLPYSVRPIALSKGEQKEEWYLTLNPNGRIPTIVDHDNDDFAVFESGAQCRSVSIWARTRNNSSKVRRRCWRRNRSGGKNYFIS